MQQAITQGVEVRDYEFALAYSDGTTRTLFGNAVPLRDRQGRVSGAVGAFVDITGQKQITETIRQSEERYRTMGETLPYGVWLCDAQGSALYTSQSFLDLLNMSMEEMQQFGWTQRLVPEDVEPTLKKWLHCIETGEMWDHEHRIIDRHGDIRTVLTRGLPVRDENGMVTGWVGLNLDITDRKRMELRLHEQAEALEQANRLKDDFLATLSHELRTPLGAIVGWSDMLRKGALEGGAVERAVESINRNAKIQNELINDVLDVSRIVSGKMTLEMQPLDLSVVLANAVESVRPTANAKHIALATEIPAPPAAVTGDATRLQQIFWNLLTNALKFTPSGGQVRVCLHSREEHIDVEVTDTGIGIGPDFLPHVFERFRQSDSSLTRRYGGLGLGLAIVRHLVELHGGSVAARSGGEGQGATFTVTLPVSEMGRRSVSGPIRRAPTVESSSDPLPSLQGIRVLVVEDEPDAREMVNSVLTHHGATVAVAAGAVEALESYPRFAPHVLLLDIALPDVDGYELLQRIRAGAGETGKRVPAIALTALARREDRERAVATGFQEHLAKPVEGAELVRAVAKACR